VSSRKPIAWLGDSLTRLRAAPADIRSDAGYQLDLVQRGEAPTDFRPMPDVGPGAMEIRVHGENEFRVFYVARFAEGVYVLHCFVKKTRATRRADIDLGKQRYAALLELRRSRMRAVKR
jgi:phage-related protein